MHFTVLVIGKDYDLQLEPFWELDLSHEELRNDKRAEFNRIYSIKEAKNEYKKHNKTNPSDCKYKTFEDWVKDYGYSYDKETKSYGYYSNPNSRWDWYIVGGRWSGFFKLKKGATGNLGEPGVFDNKPRKGYVDQAKKGDIDFDGMKKDSIKDSIKIYKKFHKIVNGRNLPIYKDIVEELGTASEDIDEAKKQYNEDPVIQDLRKEKFYLDLEYYNCSLEEFIKKVSNNCITTCAVIKDGEWYEQGQMGWWGLNSSEIMTDEEWDEEFNNLLESIPDDTLLTIVDCHI